MHLKLADLLLVVNIPYSMLRVNTSAYNVAVVYDLDFVDNGMRLDIYFQHLVGLSVIQDK